MSVRFADFGAVADAVAATRSRLEKARLVGDWLSTLGDDDLRRAVLFLSGSVFAQRDQRRIQVGGRTLWKALETVTGADPDAMRQHMVRLGDLGDLAFLLYRQDPRVTALPPGRTGLRPVPDTVTALPPGRTGLRPVPLGGGEGKEAVEPTLTLAEVGETFATLAEVSGSLPRAAHLQTWLARMAPIEAKYVVKLLVGDLRIGLKEGALQDALARLFDTTVESMAWTNMLLGDMAETAVLARHGRLHEAHMRLFHPIKFMLATPAASLDDVARHMPAEFVVEDKYDGIRGQVHVGPDELDATFGRASAGRRVAIFSRTLDDITTSFPDVVEAFSAVTITAILDGELLPMRGDRILPFAELQKRLGRKVLSADMLAAVPVSFVAYDLLYSDGEVRLEAPFSERRAGLERLGVWGQRIRLAGSQRFTDAAALDAEFAAARARHNEGLLVKDPVSTYKPGRRGREWLKIKRAIAALDVVVTAVEVGHGRRARLLSDYTFAVRQSETDGTLLNVGKAYSGLTDQEIETLGHWFREHTVASFGHGRYRVVEPHIVLEVTFDAVQPSSRHQSGYALRFPRILRVRDDKPASDIDTVATVARLATRPHEEADEPPSNHASDGGGLA